MRHSRFVKKTPCTSVPPLYDICTATFCAFLSQSLLLVFGALLAGWLCSSGVFGPRSSQHARRRPFSSPLEIHVRTRRIHQNSYRASMSSRNWCFPWSGVSGQFPLTRQAWVLVHAPLPKHRCQHLLMAKSSLRHSFGPAHSARYEFHCLRHFPLSVFLFVRSLFSFLLTVPIPPRHCKGSTFPICSDRAPMAKLHSLFNFHAGLHKRMRQRPAQLP